MSDISKTTINMPVDLKKELKKIAIDKDTSLSGLILDIITEYVESGSKTESQQTEDSY
ncbi:Met repressor [uncultured Methanobrevibacter sp.]|uniref:Met repressor n=1 Tax=uncultured Methanobrevibacter sp. TaxID=253161 RepID=UPI00262C903E|nr:Met repressor [uncultured Methanobrevibacter sp.]